MRRLLPLTPIVLCLLPAPVMAQITPDTLIAAVADAALDQVPPDDPTAPRHTRAQAFGFWLVGGSHVIDVAQTMRLIGEGKGREANPILASVQHHPERFAAVKWSIAGGSMLAAWDQFHRGHRKAGWTILIGSLTANAIVIANNHRVIQTTR